MRLYIHNAIVYPRGRKSPLTFEPGVLEATDNLGNELVKHFPNDGVCEMQDWETEADHRWNCASKQMRSQEGRTSKQRRKLQALARRRSITARRG